MEYVKSLKEDTQYLEKMLDSLKRTYEKEKLFFETLTSPSSQEISQDETTSMFVTPERRTNSLFSKEAENAWSMKKSFTYIQSTSTPQTNGVDL